MLFGETLRVAFQSIRANLLRSLLTMLGIIIGVAAVITMVALGTGAQRAVEEQISSLGANLLQVYAGQSMHRGVASANRVSLTTDDAVALELEATLLSEIVPELRSSLQAKYGNKNINVNVNGTTPNYVPVNNFSIEHGRMFTAGDDEARQRYAVLGGAIPEMLETNAAALINQTLLIRSIPFKIIGILEEKGAEGSWSNPDEQILIPLGTAQFRVFGTDRLRSITVEVADNVPLEQGMVDLERVLRKEHKIAPGRDNDFQIRNRQSILATRQEATQIFTYLLAGIAGVSLLVGGIGIMNIMLVSVTERTREIGVRKALGATKMNILLQFLVEALALCLAGGVLGILLGSGGAVALARLAGWNTLVSPLAVVLAFAFSAAIGIFFGIYPARRASLLDPIDALRHE
ncbi:MAG: FtsX-like permease family protein [Gemmatimonadales bacterium]|nr:FtsX-like permease family protein [Gemmatimonadales bacterium]